MLKIFEGSSRAFVWISVILLASGCNPFGACTDLAAPGIRLTVLDSITGAPASGEGTIVATSGAYTDSVSLPAEVPSEAPVFFLAVERAGTYRVEVNASDYQSWVREGVRVIDDGCHVRPVDLMALLQRLE